MQGKYIADIDGTQTDTFAWLENLSQKEVKTEIQATWSLPGHVLWICVESSLTYSLATLDWKIQSTAVQTAQTASQNISRKRRCQIAVLMRPLLLRDRKLINGGCEVENTEIIAWK